MTDTETRPVHSVLCSDVKIRAPRQRSELGDLEGLAESLLRHGQLQPIILTRNNELIAGERRLRATQLNGQLHIEALYRDELDELTLEELELEENIRRKQLTWQEENAAIARVHSIRKQRDPKWGQRQTAEVIAEPGRNPMDVQKDVSQAISLDRMMKLFPEIAKAKNFSQAMNMAKAKAKQVTKVVDVQQRPEIYKEVQEKIWLGDSVVLIKDIEDESFDMSLTDPPFGVNYDAQVGGTVRETDVYKDDAKRYERILSMAPDIYRVLRKDGWLVWFFGMTWYEEVKSTFRGAGFTVDEIPIMWDRSGGRTHTNQPNHYFTKGYDVALHAFKGDPILVRKNLPNVITVDPVETKDRELTVERPVDLYKEILSRHLIKGQNVIDFFVGSGSVLAAAAELGIDYTGIEQDEVRRSHAIQKVRAHIPTK